MSDVYDQFIAETYATMHGAVDDALRQPGDRPALIYIGEKHRISAASLLEQPENQEPAMAGAYAEISALDAAMRLAGKDNVTLSVELNEEQLEFFKLEIGAVIEIEQLFPELSNSPFEEAIAKNEQHLLSITGKFGTSAEPGDPDFQIIRERLRANPMIRTIRYAMENGIEIVPSDPLKGQGGVYEREQQTIQALNTLAQSDEAPRAVVHLAGARHIIPSQGYTFEEVRDADGDLIVDPERSPYMDHFGHVSFTNFAQTPQSLRDKFAHTTDPRVQGRLQDMKYVTNPANAVQIDPPGEIPYAYIKGIEEKVAAAAARFNGENAPTHPQQTPTPAAGALTP